MESSLVRASRQEAALPRAPEKLRFARLRDKGNAFSPFISSACILNPRIQWLLAAAREMAHALQKGFNPVTTGKNPETDENSVLSPSCPLRRPCHFVGLLRRSLLHWRWIREHHGHPIPPWLHRGSASFPLRHGNCRRGSLLSPRKRLLPPARKPVCGGRYPTELTRLE